MPDWKTDWKVGDECFVADEIHYGKFNKTTIMGETARSWITAHIIGRVSQ